MLPRLKKSRSRSWLSAFLGSNHLPVINDEGGSSLTRMSTTCRGPGADWTSNASSVSHIFVQSSSGDSCYLGEDCRHSGKTIHGHLISLDCLLCLCWGKLEQFIGGKILILLLWFLREEFEKNNITQLWQRMRQVVLIITCYFRLNIDLKIIV
jgi:hypothetical protein